MLLNIKRYALIGSGTLLLAIALLGSLFSTAHAAVHVSQTLSISNVYATDTNQQSKSVFSPGNQIYYHVDFNNSGGPIPIVVNITVQMGTTTIFDDNFNFNAPAGPTRMYTPSTIPSNAQNGSYTINYVLSQNGYPAENHAVSSGSITVLRPDLSGSGSSGSSAQLRRDLHHLQDQVNPEVFNKLVDILSGAKDIATCAKGFNEAQKNSAGGYTTLYIFLSGYASEACGEQTIQGVGEFLQSVGIELDINQETFVEFLKSLPPE